MSGRGADSRSLPRQGGSSGSSQSQVRWREYGIRSALTLVAELLRSTTSRQAVVGASRPGRTVRECRFVGRTSATREGMRRLLSHPSEAHGLSSRSSSRLVQFFGAGGKHVQAHHRQTLEGFGSTLADRERERYRDAALGKTTKRTNSSNAGAPLTTRSWMG